MTAYRIRLALTLAATAGIFWISAKHIVHVAMDAGNDFSAAIVYPVAIDVVILVSVLTMMAPTGVNRMAKWYAALGRGFGFGATIYCNVAASGFESANAMIVNLIPAVALIIMMELSVHAVKATTATRARKPVAKKVRHAAPVRKLSVAR